MVLLLMDNNKMKVLPKYIDFDDMMVVIIKAGIFFFDVAL